jgi:hypothetical protein
VVTRHANLAYTTGRLKNPLSMLLNSIALSIIMFSEVPEPLLSTPISRGNEQRIYFTLKSCHAKEHNANLGLNCDAHEYKSACCFSNV